MKSYNEGLGEHVHVEIVSGYLVSEFNLELAKKLDNGWRVVEGVHCTKIGNTNLRVMYTCMIAKARDGTVQW